jgi:thiol-disulfide isomerase/thioredoxin
MLASWILIGSVACMTDPAVEARIAQLETDVAELKAAQAERDQEPPEQHEEEASALLEKAKKLHSQMKTEEAQELLEQIDNKYGETSSAGAAKMLLADTKMVGTDAGELDVEKWYSGEATIEADKTTLLVFWEVWCPRCPDAMKSIQELDEKYGEQGLNVVALTQVSKSATEAQVQAYISDHQLSYPFAKENGSLSQRFEIRGVPYAVAIHEGKVIWRGNPARLDASLVENWIK